MDQSSQSMDDVLKYFDNCGNPGYATKAAFFFLYKEILVNRIAIFEQGDKPNRGAVEFNEKLVNELNKKLMEQMKK